MAAERQVNIIVNFLAKGLGELTTQLKGLNTEMAALRGETSKTRTQVSGLGKDAGAASDKLDEYSKNSDNARTASDELNNSSKKARGGFANFGKQLVNTAAFLLRFAAVTAIFSGVTFAIVGTAKAAAAFQESLRSLQAIANISNSELGMLEENILKVAGSTRFTAGEIAELQKNLARLGFSTYQIIESTEAIARFAEATGESSDAVAEFVGKQIKAFGLATIDTTELVNAYTTSINNSALSLETLATSSQYASSISSALGVGFKEQNALLATLADNGLTASRAGTGLRKIFLELGASGGSLIPILNELGESNLTIAEAEELVGARAAGALVTLVSQREAVTRLVDAQNNLSSAFIASARQNSTFNAQVDALNAAVNRILISLGDWVTKTEIILNLIERFGGGTELRGFRLQTALGLDSEQVDGMVGNITELEYKLKGFIDSYNKTIEEGGQRYGTDVEGMSRRLALQKSLAGDIAESLGISAEAFKKASDELGGIEISDYEALLGVLRDISDERIRTNQITVAADLIGKEYADKIKEIVELDRKGVDISKERDGLLKKVQTKIAMLSLSLFEYSQATEELTEKEIAQQSIEEKALSRFRMMQTALINLKTSQKDLADSGTVQLQSFEAIRKKQEALNQAIIDGDEVKRRSLAADLEKQKNLLIEVDLLDDYLNYVSRIESREELLQAASGFKEAAGVLSEVLQDEIDLGKKTPEQAKEELGRLIDSYIKALDQLPAEQRDKLQKELSLLFSGTEFTPAEDGGGGGAGEKGLDLFGLGEENTEFLINKAAELANSVNSAILDATQRRLEAEQAAVDARYSFEEDRLNSLLQAGIISQEQYERQRLRLEKERVAKTNDIERKRFNAEKANSLAEIAIKTAIGIAGTADPIRIAIISAVSAAQAAIVASQKFVPTKFKKGGMIEGASHERGGVPFTVNGRAGFEAEGGEFIVNKKATEAFLPMLERINSFGSSSIPAQRQVFASGGVVPQGGGRTDDLLEQLVSQSSQRTIAYISEEQLISRNNTRITNDIRKRL